MCEATVLTFRFTKEISNSLISSAETVRIQCGNRAIPARKRTESSAETVRIQCGNGAIPVRKWRAFIGGNLNRGICKKNLKRDSFAIENFFYVVYNSNIRCLRIILKLQQLNVKGDKNDRDTNERNH
jgi:hypothetical protein